MWKGCTLVGCGASFCSSYGSWEQLKIIRIMSSFNYPVLYTASDCSFLTYYKKWNQRPTCFCSFLNSQLSVFYNTLNQKKTQPYHVTKSPTVLGWIRPAEQHMYVRANADNMGKTAQKFPTRLGDTVIGWMWFNCLVYFPHGCSLFIAFANKSAFLYVWWYFNIVWITDRVKHTVGGRTWVWGGKKGQEKEVWDLNNLCKCLSISLAAYNRWNFDSDLCR